MATQIIPADAGATTTIQLDQLGSAIGTTVADELEREVNEAIENTNLEIVTAEDYKALTDHRDGTLQVLLKGPKVKTVDAERSAIVRLVLQIENSKGRKVAIAIEMPLSTRSVEEFYGPLASLLDGAHKGVTGSRKLVTEKLNETIKAISPALLKWRDAQAKLEAERKEKERLEREQLQRTHEAEHWINQLSLHGATRSEVLTMLGKGTESVTGEDVKTLETLLTEKLKEEAEAREITQLTSAVKMALECGHPEVGLDNAVNAGHLEVAEHVLGKEMIEGINADRKRKAEEARKKNLPPPPAPATPQPDFFPPAPRIVSAPAPLPPPPPRPMPAPATIRQTAVPKVVGEGVRSTFHLEIDNPYLIQAQYLLPLDEKLYDADAYPRLKGMAAKQGKSLESVCAGIRVVEDRNVTGRRK